MTVVVSVFSKSIHCHVNKDPLLKIISRHLLSNMFGRDWTIVLTTVAIISYDAIKLLVESYNSLSKVILID